MSTLKINSGPKEKNADIQQIQGEKDSRSNNYSLQSGVPAHVIFKLLGFTLAMVVGPIGCYFTTLNKIFGGNSTYAGATAAIVANLILAGYIIVAFREDQSQALETKEEKKKK